jgi:hypothetical protein
LPLCRSRIRRPQGNCSAAPPVCRSDRTVLSCHSSASEDSVESIRGSGSGLCLHLSQKHSHEPESKLECSVAVLVRRLPRALEQPSSLRRCALRFTERISVQVRAAQKAPSKLRCYETSSGEGASVSQLPLESAHQRTICRELCAVQSHPDSGDRGWRFMPPSQTRSPAPNLANLRAADHQSQTSPAVPVPLLPCNSSTLISALGLWAAERERVGSVGERQDATAMAE